MTCKSNGCTNPSLVMSEHCWDHLPDKEGFKITLADAVKRGDDLTGANLKKASLRGLQLGKASLAKANLSQSDISGSHLFDAMLEGAELIGADLSGCDLTHCDLKGADLARASLVGSRLWSADLRGANISESDMSGADLWNARLFNVKIWHATFINAKFLTKRNFSGDTPLNNFMVNEDGLLSAEESYRDLKSYFMTNGRYNDASWASFKEKTMERLLLKKKGDLNYFPSLLMNILCGYGEKPYRIVLSALLTIFLFAFAYAALNAVESPTASNYILRWTDYIYYSAVTFTTVGYGDFIPKAFGAFRLLAATEAFLGTFLTGLFIFTLARKYSAR